VLKLLKHAVTVVGVCYVLNLLLAKTKQQAIEVVEQTHPTENITDGDSETLPQQVRVLRKRASNIQGYYQDIVDRSWAVMVTNRIERGEAPYPEHWETMIKQVLAIGAYSAGQLMVDAKVKLVPQELWDLYKNAYENQGE
jgi:hypothetical protein